MANGAPGFLVNNRIQGNYSYEHSGYCFFAGYIDVNILTY